MKLFPKIFALFVLFCLVSIPISASEIPFSEGDRIVIYDPDTGKALSGTGSSRDVTLTGEELSGYEESEIFTLTQKEDGTFRLENEGQALSIGDEYDYLMLDGIHDGWLMEAAEDGRFHLRNTGRDMLLTLNTRRYLWSTAAPEDATGTVAFAIYVLPRESEDPVLPPQPPEGYQLYFGLLHAHTDLSDGLGSVEEAFQYASAVEGLDFFAVTDHSHSFDNADTATLTAEPVSESWARGKAAAQAVTSEHFVGIFGFEMTWNQGQGHMSTFNTPGFLSREQEPYGSYATGMERYFDALLEAPQSISQFNHPGTQYGSFKYFAGLTPELDQRITLMEVEENTRYYDHALTLGWHLAPTMSQNNHAGQWGDATGQRTVILSSGLTETALYEAMADYRVYATEDPDLEILFSLGDHPMGSRVPRSQIGSAVELVCQLYDPTDPQLGTLEIVTEDGLVLETLSLSGQKSRAAVTLPANRGYYYLRLTQPDGDWAVTAPIWLDDRDDMGISGLTTASEVTTAGKMQEFTVTICNNEPEPLTITEVHLALDGQTLSDTKGYTVAPFRAAQIIFSHTFPADGAYTLTATARGEYDGELRQFSHTQSLTVLPPPLVDDVRILASREDFQEILALAAQQEVDLRLLTELPTPDELETCCLLVIPVPETAPDAPLLSLLRSFAERGGSLLLSGASPEMNPNGAAHLNAILEALGATGRFLPEEARDEVNNQGQPHQIRTAVFAESLWTEDLQTGQYFRQNQGCALDPGEGQWLVKGLETAGSPVLLSVESLTGGGNLFLAGCGFFSDEYLDTAGADPWQQPTGNQTIAETILGLTRSAQPVIPISQLRQAVAGRIYLAEGRVTAGTANPHTTFPDTIYVQDDTGGIAASGYSTHGLALGTRVRILGILATDGENPVLKILRLTALDQENPLLPQQLLPAEALGGSLLAAEGTVTALDSEGAAVSRFALAVGGDTVNVVIERSIHSGSRGVNELARIVRAGNTLRAVGLCHQIGGRWLLRVRDCDEITLLEGTPGTLPTEETEPVLPEGCSDGEDDNTGEVPDTGDGIRLYLLLMFLSLADLCWLLEKTDIKKAAAFAAALAVVIRFSGRFPGTGGTHSPFRNGMPFCPRCSPGAAGCSALPVPEQAGSWWSAWGWCIRRWASRRSPPRTRPPAPACLRPAEPGWRRWPLRRT